MSTDSPQPFHERFLLPSKVAAERLSITPTTLYRDIAPYLHRLALTGTGHARYSSAYVIEFLNHKNEDAPDVPLTTFARAFARNADITNLVANTEQAFEFAVDEQVLDLVDVSGERRLLTAAGIMSLVGIAQPTVSSWIDRGLLVPETLSEVPYQRGQGMHAYFPENQFRSIVEWQRPI